jgi:hypothetical protein
MVPYRFTCAHIEDLYIQVTSLSIRHEHYRNRIRFLQNDECAHLVESPRSIREAESAATSVVPLKGPSE